MLGATTRDGRLAVVPAAPDVPLMNNAIHLPLVLGTCEVLPIDQ
jgi:hypothetical protein